MALETKIRLEDEYDVIFDSNTGLDLSNAYYANPSIVNVFGLPRETKERLYCVEETSVNVDKLSICCHNNRTHTEATKHIYANGLNISDIDNVSKLYGCIVISVTPIPIHKMNSNHDTYQCGVDIDKENDRIITKSMIENNVKQIEQRYINLPSFFKQCIFIRVTSKDIDGNTIDFNSNWPFLSNDAMQYLYENISCIFGINLCSVDRMESPKIPNHHIWFGNNPKSHRLITEGLQIGNHILDDIYVLNFQLSPIANTDAVPTRPIIYPCKLHKHLLSKL